MWSGWDCFVCYVINYNVPNFLSVTLTVLSFLAQNHNMAAKPTWALGRKGSYVCRRSTDLRGSKPCGGSAQALVIGQGNTLVEKCLAMSLGQAWAPNGWIFTTPTWAPLARSYHQDVMTGPSKQWTWKWGEGLGLINGHFKRYIALKRSPTGPAPLVVSCPEKSLSEYWVSCLECRTWNFPGGPVVKNLFSNAKGCKCDPWLGTKIPYSTGPLSPRATIREKPVGSKEGAGTPQWRACVPQLRPNAAKRIQNWVWNAEPKWVLFKAPEVVRQGEALAALDNLSGYHSQCWVLSLGVQKVKYQERFNQRAECGPG